MNSMHALLLDVLADSTVQIAFVAGVMFLLVRFRQARPTARAFALLGLPVPLLLLGFVWPAIISWIPVYNALLMLLLLVDGVALSVPVNHLHLERHAPPTLPVGQAAFIRLAVRNNGRHPVQGVVQDDTPPALWPSATPRTPIPITVMPGEIQHAAYRVWPDDRDRLDFGQVHLQYRSRLGLLWLHAQGGASEAITVTPDLRRVGELRVIYSRAMMQGELQKRSLGLEGTQFSGLRSYVTGDDVRKIAWRSTAKVDAPIMRTFEPEVEQSLLILLDAGRGMLSRTPGPPDRVALRKFDWALNAALAFMSVVLERGDRVGVGAFSNRVLADVPIGSGLSHRRRMLDTLGAVEAEASEPLYETALAPFARHLKRRALVVLLTDVSDPWQARQLQRGLQAFTSHHLVLVVTLADRPLESRAALHPESALAAYEKGVALDLLAQRRLAMAELTRSRRLVVVDALPEALDEALINRYLTIKRQGAL